MSVVFELMHTDPVLVDSDSPVIEAARRMSSASVGALIVVSGGQIVGILTERDLVKNVLAPMKDGTDLLVRDVMTTDPVTVSPDESVETCLSCFLELGFRHLPVLSRDGKIVGMLSSRDFLPHLRGKFGKIMDEKAYLRFLEELDILDTH